MSAPRIELLYWEGCPSHPQALAQLRAALDSLGRGDLPVTLERVESDHQAHAERFAGSPTIRVDGVDPFPPGDGEPFSLCCRVYRLMDGRFSPTPDPGQLRERLARLLRSPPG